MTEDVPPLVNIIYWALITLFGGYVIGYNLCRMEYRESYDDLVQRHHDLEQRYEELKQRYEEV